MGKPSVSLHVIAALVVAAAWAGLSAQTGHAQETDDFRLPNAELAAFLKSLPVAEAPAATINSVAPPPVDAANWPYLTESSVPVSSPTQVMLQFDPDATPAQVAALIEQHKLIIRDTRQAAIGAILAEVPATSSSLVLRDLGLSVDPLADAVRQLRDEPVLRSAGAQSVLSTHQLRAALEPETRDMAMGAATEEVDWGIQQAHIEPAWPLVAGKSFKVGVIDVGFAPHEDITSTPGLAGITMPQADHGNHVSGIICAMHNNLGVKGVVPDCTAVISTSAPLLDTIEDNNLVGFYTLFSELVATIVLFIENNPDVKVINLSLGYNWFPNFQIDPTGSDYAALRDLVRSQGVIFATILELAKQNDIAIVSAAGNDSSTLPEPTDARWASPFNWAAKRVRDVSGWSNGVVVEAHDSQGMRAGFSNVGGDISAPGVSILSALRTGYGRLSGTSMASPYVTGALTLLRTATPDRSLQGHIKCLLGGTTKSSSGAPMLDLEGAIARCSD